MSGNGNQLDIMSLPFTTAGWPMPIPTKKGVIKDISMFNRVLLPRLGIGFALICPHMPSTPIRNQAELVLISTI